MISFTSEPCKFILKYGIENYLRLFMKTFICFIEIQHTQT